MNIMIIIFIFKAGWYNEWLKKIAAAGKPHNNCPAGNNADFVKAQTTLNGLFATYVDGQYATYVNAFTKYHDTWCKTAPVFTTWDAAWIKYLKGEKDCSDNLDTRALWNAAGKTCKFVKADATNKG